MLVVVMNKPWAYSSLNINGNMMLAQTDPTIFISVYAWVGTSPSTWQIPGWICRTYKYPICGIQAELTWYLLRDYKYRVPLLDSHYSEQLHCLSSRGKRRNKHLTVKLCVRFWQMLTLPCHCHISARLLLCQHHINT